ncbi:MAG: transglutaminase domain-containing protein [Caulobacter sp.]|nr:transglutaminase domain-containing protein [Caulobacter sp.]
MKLLLSGLLCLVALTAAAASPPPEPANVTWYVLQADDGARIGYATQSVTETPAGREVVQEQQVRLQERGSAATTLTTRTVFTQDRLGATRSIRISTTAGRSWTRHEARLEPGLARITRQSATDRRATSLALPPGVRFDGGDALLKTWNPATTPKIEFDSLDVDGEAIEHVVIEAMPADDGDPPGGFSALQKRYEDGQLQSIARLRLGADRRVVSTTRPMFGASATLTLSDRETALQPHPPFRVIPRLMTKSLFRIQTGALRGHIRYRFGFRDGIQFDMPVTGEQRARVSPGATVIDICDDCGPGLPTDEAYLADALKATAWLQSDSPRLKAIAGPVARMKVSDSRKMEILLKKARPWLGKIDFVGHYSALETLDRRAGDCTEAAVLLAALGRSAGIPTRVVNGLVYSRERYHGVSNAFLPHSWTLAYVDGAWRSFDLALDSFDATHIAISIGDGDARSLSAASQLGSLLLWQDMKEVRARPD